MPQELAVDLFQELGGDKKLERCGWIKNSQALLPYVKDPFTDKLSGVIWNFTEKKGRFLLC